MLYYKQGNYEEALKNYQSLMENNLDKNTKANIYHNIGNSSANRRNTISALKLIKMPFATILMIRIRNTIFLMRENAEETTTAAKTATAKQG